MQPAEFSQAVPVQMTGIGVHVNAQSMRRHYTDHLRLSRTLDRRSTMALSQGSFTSMVMGFFYCVWDWHHIWEPLFDELILELQKAISITLSLRIPEGKECFDSVGNWIRNLGSIQIMHVHHMILTGWWTFYGNKFTYCEGKTELHIRKPLTFNYSDIKHKHISLWVCWTHQRCVL